MFISVCLSFSSKTEKRYDCIRIEKESTKLQCRQHNKTIKNRIEKTASLKTQKGRSNNFLYTLFVKKKYAQGKIQASYPIIIKKKICGRTRRQNISL